MDHSQETQSNHDSPSYHTTKERQEENKNIVIVKNLSNLVRDINLFSKFQRYGDIKGVSVQVDKMTRVSKEIGFVQFSKAEHVKQCIDELNFKTYMGRELYLINKDLYLESKKFASTYFVSNLPENLTNVDFRNYMKQFGEVIISELYFIKKDGELKVDYGKVTFATKEEGDAFLEKAEANELVIENNVLRVKNFSMKEQESHLGYNLLIYNFPPSWNAQAIKDYLAKTSGEQILDKCTISQSKKKSYTVKLTLSSKSDSKMLIERYNGECIIEGEEKYLLVCTKFLNKKNLAIQYKTEQVLQQSEKQQNLLIKYVKPSVTQEQFLRIINYFGVPASAVLKQSSIAYPENPTQFFQMGFVSFVNPESAQKLLNEYKFNPDLLSIVHLSNQQCAFVKPLLNKYEKKMFMDVKEQKNQKIDQYDDLSNSQYASQDLDQSQIEGHENEDFDSHVMDLLNSYNKYESPLSFIEMLESEKKDIIEKMDSHSSQLLFSYILEDYLQRYFPELEQ